MNKGNRQILSKSLLEHKYMDVNYILNKDDMEKARTAKVLL